LGDGCNLVTPALRHSQPVGGLAAIQLVGSWQGSSNLAVTNLAVINLAVINPAVINLAAINLAAGRDLPGR